MPETPFKIKFTSVSDNTREIYKKRIDTLLRLCECDDIRTVMKHPNTYYAKLVERYGDNLHTIHSYVTPITKLYSSNPDYANTHKKPYAIWKRLMLSLDQSIEEDYKNNEAREDKLEKVVTMDEIRSKLTELEKDMQETNRLYSSHRRYLLLFLFASIHPKRADLGEVYIYNSATIKQVPKDSLKKQNYIVLRGKDSYLQVNLFKTAKYNPEGINEILCDDVVKVISASIELYPRKCLFTDLQFNPLKRNAYSHFVRRTFEFLFDRKMGVNIWRHVFLTQMVDFNTVSQKKQEEIAKLMGTSKLVGHGVYNWVNLPENESSGNTKRLICSQPPL